MAERPNDKSNGIDEDRRKKVFDPLGVATRNKSKEEQLSVGDISALTGDNPFYAAPLLAIRAVWRHFKGRK